MIKSRVSADLIAIIEGLMWLLLAWSISLIIELRSILPIVIALGIISGLIFTAWIHKPLRVNMQRYRTRRRRTEMYMHLFSLPIILALLITVILEILFSTSFNGFQKILLVNIMATAGWAFFVLTLVFRQLHFALRTKNIKRHQ